MVVVMVVPGVPKADKIVVVAEVVQAVTQVMVVMVELALPMALLVQAEVEAVGQDMMCILIQVVYAAPVEVV
jgi:hypothetical protein